MNAAGLIALCETEYRAAECGGAWFCVAGEDFAAAPMYDTEEEAQEAADDMNAAVLRAIRNA